MIKLESSFIALALDERSGAVRRLHDVRRGTEFVREDAPPSEPFRLETDEGFSSTFESFDWSMETEDGQPAVSLRWTTADGVSLRAWITFEEDGAALAFRCRADNGSSKRLLSVEYPIIGGLGEITPGGTDDYLAHPFATGFRIRNPMQNFDERFGGFRFMPYPECFSGASMQFFAWYGMGAGGLYFFVPDGDGYPKWLNFCKNDKGRLEAAFIHGCEDMGPGKGVAPSYPVRVELLEGRDWYEAADRYKSWAVRQRWCSRGTLAERADNGDHDGSWLHREMGAATFGINAGADRTPWLRKYREHIHAPIFHVLGPDWTNAPQTFYKGVPGGFDDWFPTRFNPDTLACIRDAGDRFAPFEFDYLYHFEGADGQLGLEAAQKFPEHKKSIDAYRFPLLCPAHPYTHDFHVRRDAELLRTVNIDAIYYDISANNILKVCMDPSHGHPVGAGRAIEEAYRRNYADTKAAMAEAAGRYVPMGTEMMNETLLGLIDFYQARAGAQPAAPLEGYPLRHLLKTGDAELIPMFDYVYHEYGAVRMDGWGKLVEEIGGLFFYTVARTYLWGGLYELNYEYSPMEALDGIENAPEEHYYPFEPRGYAFSPGRAQYVNLFAKLRVGAANPFWAYGQMLRPLPIAAGRIRMDWFHYNHGTNSPEYNDSGVQEVEAVIHSAWRSPDGRIGLFFANVSEEEREVNMAVQDLQALGVPWREIRGTLYAVDREEPIAAGEPAGGRIALAVPARSVAFLQAAGAAGIEQKL